MRSAKVCIVGDFAVGKTSTVARYVHREFSDKYLTTVGVKIDTKEVETRHGPIKLIIWDVAGTDRFADIEFAYLRGSAGILLVADGTRERTVDSALGLRADVVDTLGTVPIVAILNKADLSSEWRIGDDVLARDRAVGVDWRQCSAKSGEGVEEAIAELAESIAAAFEDPG